MWFLCKFGGGGITNSQIITEEEKYSLDARQNNPNISGSLRNEIISLANSVFTLEHKIEVSGYFSNNLDWNKIVTSGVYKIQNCYMTASNHAPVGLYGYGILEVKRSEFTGEYRALQIYYPHNNNTKETTVLIAYRMYNQRTDMVTIEEENWSPWWTVIGNRLI